MKTINGQTNFAYEFTVDGRTIVKVIGEENLDQNPKKDINNGVFNHETII